MLSVPPGERNGRLVGALLVLGVVALFFIVVGQLADAFFYFGDIFLTFFLAWLLAFIISPIVGRLMAIDPRLPRAAAAVIVYTVVVLVMVIVVIAAAGALATSIAQFVASIPDIRANLPAIVAPWQELLNSVGLGQVDLVATGNTVAAALAEKVPARAPTLKYVIKDSPCFIGLNKDEPNLLAKVNEIIAQAKASGEIAKLSEKWLKAPLPPGF